MIVLTDTLLSITDYLPQEKVLIISKKPVYAKENVVIEDIGFKEKLSGIIVGAGFNSPTYTYHCTISQINKVIDKIRLYKNIVIVIDGTNGFDIGVLTAILEKISGMEYFERIVIIVTYNVRELEERGPRLSIYMYSVIKLLSIASSLSITRNSRIAYTIVHNSYKPQELASIVDLVYNLSKLIDFNGFFIIGYIKYIIPIEVVKNILYLLNIDLAIDEYIKETRSFLVLANKVLDKSVDTGSLWERAREDKKYIWPIRYDLERVLKKRRDIQKMLRFLYTELTSCQDPFKKYPSMDTINYIATRLLKMEPCENIIKDTILIDKIVYELKKVLESIPLLMVFGEHSIKYPFKRKYLVTSNTLKHVVERIELKKGVRETILVEQNGYQITVLGLDKIPMDLEHMPSYILSFFEELSKTYLNNINVLVLTDEIYPKYLTLYSIRIDSETLHKIPLIDIDGLYYSLEKAMETLMARGCSDEVVRKLVEYRERSRLLSSILYLPPPYYTSLLDTLDKLRRLSNIEQCVDILEDTINLLSP